MPTSFKRAKTVGRWSWLCWTMRSSSERMPTTRLRSSITGAPPMLRSISLATASPTLSLGLKVTTSVVMMSPTNCGSAIRASRVGPEGPS